MILSNATIETKRRVWKWRIESVLVPGCEAFVVAVAGVPLAATEVAETVVVFDGASRPVIGEAVVFSAAEPDVDMCLGLCQKTTQNQ